MTESILLYINLRSKQIVRILSGIGTFRCLFLLGLAAVLFYAFTKLNNVWILPSCYMLILWFYHNSRKDKEFLLLQIHGVKRLLTAEYLLLGLPFIISGIIASNYISIAVITITAVIMPWIHSVRYHSIVLPLPILHRGDILYRRMFRQQIPVYLILLLISIMGVIHENINLIKVCMILWGAIQGTAYMVIPQKHELTNYCSFRMYYIRLIQSVIWNVVITTIPFIVLIPTHKYDFEILFFHLTMIFSTFLYLWNIGIPRFLFNTQTILGMYWLLLPLPLFMASIIIPIMFIPLLVLNISIFIYINKEYQHIWN